MTPQAGIAHYRIVSKLGEGGMGAVYRAHDTKLNRDVAIKVLPDSFADDPDRLARFTREAQVLASLNHPNIAAIYGVEERALVMELVEGGEPRGPLSAEEALPILHQLIDALEYAHDRGIVHRDLKPANLRVTPEGRLKVLDFGLAKALSTDAPAPNPANSPTLTMRATMAGVIMGTAGYMSPEQARGQNTDRRADIWAFGVVVYELLTGGALFEGATVSDTLAAVLTRDPDLAAVPARFRRLLRLCLLRDARERLSHISSARLLLEPPESAPAARSSRAPWLIAAVAVAGLAIAGAMLYRATRPLERAPFIRLEGVLGADVRIARSQSTSFLALSPDGARVAIAHRGTDGKVRLGLRQLDEAQFVTLPDTEGAQAPVFSPDSQWIAYTAENQLRKIFIRGGAPVRLSSEVSTGRGAFWDGDDLYVTTSLAPSAAGVRGGIYRLPASGGTPVAVTRLGPGEVTHRWPFALPGGKALLFTSHTSADGGGYDQANIDVVEFAGGRRRTIVRGGFGARFLPAPGGSGYLLYMQRNTLYASPFDPGRLSLTGPALPVVSDVDSSARGGGDYGVSSNGTLVYREGHSARGWSIYWMDPSGKTEPLHKSPGAYYAPRLSPDGRHLAFALATGNGSDIWVKDVDRDAATRLTNLPGDNRWIVWSADSRGLFFTSQQVDASAFYWVPADGSAGPVKLEDASLLRSAVPTSVSPDGRRLAVQAEVGPQERHPNIFTIPILGDPAHPKLGKAELFASSPYVNVYPAFSPDGRWLAYASSDTGVSEVYVSPFPGPGARVQVSSGGGSNPIWSRGGRELLFRDADQRVEVLSYQVDAAGFHAGKPRAWSAVRVMNVANFSTFDLAPDGKRMAVIPAVAPGEIEKPQNTLVFLLNFTSELERRFRDAK